jgi:hypothetical protein
MHPFKSRDKNCFARDLTQWFGYAFHESNLVGHANADSEEELLAHFRSVATGALKIHYWPPGTRPERRVVVIESPQQRQVG